MMVATEQDPETTPPPRAPTKATRTDPPPMTDESLRDDEPKIPPTHNGAGRRPEDRNVLVTPSPQRDGKRPGSTEDEQLLNRRMPPTPRPKAPELAAFTHTDPWRIMRIQA